MMLVPLSGPRIPTIGASVTPAELDRLLATHVQTPAQQALLRIVFQSYRVAHEDSRRYSAAQAQTIVGEMVRSTLEDGLAGVAERFGLVSTDERAPGSKWRRTQLHAGPIILIEKAVETPCGLMDFAHFRRALVESSQLRWRFDDDRGRIGDPESVVVALLHSRATDGDPLHLPGSAYLAFPARDVPFYVHEVSLFERFPDVARSLTPQDWNDEAFVRYLGHARKHVI
jgi:hypothetical protein